MMDFSQGAGKSSGSELIPNGQLAWVFIAVRGVKASGSGGQYIDVELTIDDGQPFGRRKIWEMIGDPAHPGNSEKYREMGQIALARILEAGRGAGPHNPAGYQINGYQDLNGLRVPVKIRIEKGSGGYEDKNKVGEWLTPNPASASYKFFEQLQKGIYNASAGTPTPPSTNGFGSQAQPQQTGFAGFGAQGSVNNQNPNGANMGQSASGFPQSQPTGAPGWGNASAQPAADQQGQTGFAGTATATGPSPSDGQPAWLAQANGQQS
jgi:hypothetical protein